MSTPGVASRAVRASVAASLVVGLASGPLVAGASARTADAGPVQWRRQVLSLINEARSRHGLEPFRINRGLSDDAMAHTREMVGRRRVFPTEDVDDLVEPYGATLWAEELARGRTLEANVRAWLNHANTRRHLLDPRLGNAAIGVLFSNGRYWVTAYLHD